MRIALDDAELDVIDEGNGPPVVLIHGFPLSKESWDEQARDLRATHRVIRPDLRGLGASSVPPGPYLMEQHAGDLAAVLDALGVERAAIVGHSLGSYVALAFMRLFAERVTALGLVCGGADADDAATVAFRLALAETIERAGMGPAVDAYVPRYFAAEQYAGAAPLAARATAAILGAPPRGAAATLRGVAARSDAMDLLEDIDVPTLVVAGRYDAIKSLGHNQAVAAGIRSARLVVLECGHFPLWEMPDALSGELGTLLAQVKEA